jgi:integrase
MLRTPRRQRKLRLRPEPEWWAELSAGFLRDCIRRGRTPNTKRTYYCELVDFGRWLFRTDVPSLFAVGSEHIEAWQDDLRERKAPGTRRLAAVVIRAALKWAANEDFPLSKPTLWMRVVAPKTPRLKPRPIPVKDLTAILSHLESALIEVPAPSLLALRTRALFWLVLSSGARISSALSLNRTSIVDGVAVVVQKGGDEHALMISAKAQTALNDYLAARTDTCLALFVSYSGPRVGERLEAIEAQKAWTLLCLELGIPRFTSHHIRHSCATALIRQKVNVVVAAKHMGHRGMGSIQGYVEIDIEERLAAVQAIDLRVATLTEGVQMVMAGM